MFLRLTGDLFAVIHTTVGLKQEFNKA